MITLYIVTEHRLDPIREAVAVSVLTEINAVTLESTLSTLTALTALAWITLRTSELLSLFSGERLGELALENSIT